MNSQPISKPIFASMKSTLNIDVMSILDSSKFLTEANLADQHELVIDLFESVETKSRLEPVADRILDLAILNSSSLSNETKLRYLKLSTPYCSKAILNRLFENFCAQFAETITSQGETKRANYLVSYLDTLITCSRSSNTRVHEFETHRESRERGERVIHTAVELLMRSDEVSFGKLAIAILERLARLDAFRAQVLERCHRDVIVNSALSSSSSNHHHGQVGDRKKRLENHVGVLELSLTTALADALFQQAASSSSPSTSYLNKIEFWTLVQHGLAHTNPLSRRQALYLLKRANDFVTKLKQNGVLNRDQKTTTTTADTFCLKLNEQTYGDVNHESVYLYRADWSAWNDFFLCIEVLEETSVHIVKPTLVKFESLIEAIKRNEFHVSWLLVLIRRAFIHESKFIVRWAVSCFFRSATHSLMAPFRPRTPLVHQLNEFIINDLVLILQKSHLYKRADDSPCLDNRCPKIGLELGLFFNSYLQSLADEKLRISFVEDLTEEINAFQWNSICLMHLVKAIGDIEVNHLPNLSTCVIRNINTTIMCGLTTHEVYIRSATQTIFTKFLIEHLQPSSLNMDTLRSAVDMLNSLSTKECLMYGNSTWSAIVAWLANLTQTSELTQRMVKSFLQSELDSFVSASTCDFYSILSGSNRIAKLILWLTELDSANSHSTALSSVNPICRPVFELLVDKLSSCNKHVYASAHKIEKFIFTFHFMIYHLNQSNFGDRKSSSVVSIVQHVHETCSLELIDFMLRKINRDDEQAFSYDSFLSYVELIEHILAFDATPIARLKLADKITKHILPVINSAIHNPASDKNFSSEWKRFMNLVLLSAILSSPYYQKCVLDALKSNGSAINSFEFVNNLLNLKIPTKADFSKQNKDVCKPVSDYISESFSVFTGRYHQALWSIFDFVLAFYDHFSTIYTTDAGQLLEILIDRFKIVIDFSSQFYLASYIKHGRHLVTLVNEKFTSRKPALVDIFRSMYDQVWEMKTDVRNFNESLGEFLKLFYAKSNVLNDPDGSFKNLLIEITRDTLRRGNDKMSAVRPLNESFLQLIAALDSHTNEFFIDTLILFIMYGDVYKKEKKHIQDIEVYIESFGPEFGTNQLLKPDYLNDLSVRLKSTFYLVVDRETTTLESAYYAKLADSIVRKDKELIGSSTKLYINSQLHRERFRLWQTLLTVYPRLSKIDHDMIFDYCELNLSTETQPSIRFINEWLMVKIIADHRLDQVADASSNYPAEKMKHFSGNKTGYTISWLSILANLVPLINDEISKITYLKNLIPIILSQILSSNFHLRTYVEAILVKLSGQIANSSLAHQPDIQLVFKQIDAIVRSPNDEKQRHASIMIKHFYFQFDVIEDYTIETIYYWLPYLSGLVEDECVSVECLLRCVGEKGGSVKLKNENTTLMNCPIGMWKFTAFRDESVYEPTVSIEDLQKKIIPWHVLLPSRDDVEDTSEVVKTRKITNQTSGKGLILVASLVDKGTNLGGISRTCEIFNVRELVVASVRALEDKEFQYLSVTSEKWLNIKEVPLKYLRTYLTEMKSLGTTLIGLEQTANSVQLHKMDFPPNSLLLLGNEKEGIPVELIQLLDYCVEIPQLGVIRSLNVHVSAAIAIWEFTKQNYLKD